MVTRGTLNIKGLEKYLEALASAGRNIDGDAQEVLTEAGVDVVADMQNLVPIDTGNLFNHIQVDGPHQSGNLNYVQVGVMKTDKDTAIYGNVIEYGSSRVAAQPYIRPALKKNKGVIRKILKSLLNNLGLKA